METFLTPVGLIALGTALAGVLVFALAPYLPSLFPASFARFIGLICVGTSMAPLWVQTASWRVPGVLAGACLLVMVFIHFAQTRRTPAAPPMESAAPAEEPSPSLQQESPADSTPV